MRTLATTAVVLMLATPAWAVDAQKETDDPANTGEPIVLSEAEMDHITAGNKFLFNYHLFNNAGIDVNASTDTGINRFTFGTEKTFLE